MTTPTPWLSPIPGLHRRDPEHRYWLGEVEFPVSVTGVLSVLKSDYAMNRIEATRGVWELRGNSCHRALELMLLSQRGWAAIEAERCHDGVEQSNWEAHLHGLDGDLSDLCSGDYADWIQPLITHDRWSQVQVIASERPTCCLARRIAGAFDVAFLDPATPPSPLRPEWVTGPARVLADLKSLGAAVAKWRRAGARDWSELGEVPADTAAARLSGGHAEIRATRSTTWDPLMPAPALLLAAGDDAELKASKPSTYSTAAQLGGYHTLEHHGPARNWYDYGQTIWARPGQTTFSPLYSVEEMRMAWAGAWATHRARACEPGFA
jgi:hypothetical protein